MPALQISSAVTEQVLFRKLADDIPSTTFATFGLYRYPAKFIPQVIAYVLKRYTTPGMSVFDPFAGYGTVGVVARVYGNDYELWDLNPMLKYLHDVATTELTESIDTDFAISLLRKSHENFVPKWSKLSYWFPKASLPFLYNVWGAYHSLEDEKLKRLLLIPLLKTTRWLSYNDAQRQKLSRSPMVMQKVDAVISQDWQRLFFDKLRGNLSNLAKRLEEYRGLGPKPVRAVVKTEVDTLSEDLEQERDILITSPPYLQAQEYIRASKLDLFWLGYSEIRVKQFSKMEIPYRPIPPVEIHSETYRMWHEYLKREPRLLITFDRYFWGVLGALTRLQSKIRSRIFFFVGAANVRGHPIPIDRIFAEHFSWLGWTHEKTLVDTIVSRVMFSYRSNPATGVADNRMRKEYLVVLRRT
jgi:hypothetical protein